MPTSLPNTRTGAEAPPGQRLAVTAQALYLTNLMLLPGPPFIALLYLYRRNRRNGPSLAICHLRQALSASLWAAVLLVLVNAAILGLGGYGNPGIWALVITYFVTCHAALIFLGVLGLTKAMAGRPYRFPLIGQPCER